MEVLTPEQIRQKHGLSEAEYAKLVKEVQGTTVLDAIFHWPDGPRRDILVCLVMTSR